MLFCNPGERQLEGEFVFPLPDGISVSKYGIDINGKIRYGVPIEKERGREIFQSIESRRVDPGLLEKIDGNMFRSRIFPIPANGCRKIVIGYEEMLRYNETTQSLQYILPVTSKDGLEKFFLSFNLIKQTGFPVLEGPAEIQFKQTGADINGTIERNDFKFTDRFKLSIPFDLQTPLVLMEKTGDRHYFLITTQLPPNFQERVISDHLTIIWDQSLSGLKRDHAREWEFLDSLVKKKRSLTINLYGLGMRFTRLGQFIIKDGNSNELRQVIEGLVYDGATDFSAIDLKDEKAGDLFLFSDGIATLCNPDFNQFRQPVFAVNSSTTADHSYLKYISQKTGGAFIDLTVLPVEYSLDLVTNKPLQFLGIKNSGSFEMEYYPSLPAIAINNFTLAGTCREANKTIVLQFGYGNSIVDEKPVRISYQKNKIEAADLRRIFVQKKLNELDLQFEKNKDLITRLGKEYGIVTRNTSLLVLETAADYLKYKVDPPPELKKQVDSLKNEEEDELTDSENLIVQAKEALEKLHDWWTNKPSPKKDTVALITRTTTVPPRDSLPVQQPVIISSALQNDSSGNHFIQGIVLNPEGGPIRNASIVIKGTRTGTVSDSVGRFKLIVNNDSLIIVSAAAYEPAQVQIHPGDNIRVILRAGVALGQEVIVTSAFGMRRLRSVSVSTQTIQQEDFTSALAGKTLGLAVTDRMHFSTMTSSTDTNSSPVRNIELVEWTPERVYLNEMERSNSYYATYLDLRKKYIDKPVFYFDIASFFFRKNEKEKGLLVLTNLAEITNQDAEVWRMLGYKLKELGFYKIQTFVFRRILDWRPYEPQSYRDYALALADEGRYSEAIDVLYQSLERNYEPEILDNYEGIEEIIVTEINNLIALEDKNKKQKAVVFGKEPLPVDLRIVLNWNKNLTDIDLWVTDPNGEKCYYQHALTRIGGRISSDMTEGFGPEQFLLKKAIKGVYKIEVDYYGDEQLNLSGPTTIMAEIFLNYGSKDQKRKIITLQMKDRDEKEVLVGEFKIEE
jgi:tetratricopeptide (TPR) repeat protein